jgi:Mg-chelatase subunit ChlD
MLKGCAPGSKLCLLTDGLANTGCGSMEDLPLSEIDPFYRKLAVDAKQCGVSVSVVAIKGSECKMEVLGMLAEESGGEVDIVDPRDVSKVWKNLCVCVFVCLCCVF